MVNIYTKEDYEKSYTELLEILKYIPNQYIQKIPIEKINSYKKNKDYGYKYNYDNTIKFEEQNISKLTKILIANLYIDYWADDEERKKIIEQNRKELYALELEKKKIYNTDDIFRKKQTINTNNEQITQLTIVENNNIFKKILNKIKKILKLT